MSSSEKVSADQTPLKGDRPIDAQRRCIDYRSRLKKYIGRTLGMMPERTMPDYALVKAEAAKLLNKYGYKEPPVDPVEISRREGINVSFATFTPEYAGASGFYYPAQNIIVVNKEEFPLRQTFTVAHELAHAKLHSEWAQSAEYSILWRDTSKNSKTDPHEKEANAFAASLLVPRFMLDKYFSLPASDLSELFAVSVPTIENRLAFEYGI